MREDAKIRDLLGALLFLRAEEGQAEDSSLPKALPSPPALTKRLSSYCHRNAMGMPKLAFGQLSP